MSDFSPDAGLFGPDSITWRTHADPLVGVAGIRALFLQALHPVAMAGVASNSAFRDDPWGRLARTADYVGTVSFGGTDEALRAAAAVRGVHRRVRGTDPHTGRAYRGSDPDLLLWVHAVLVESILSVTTRGGLALTPDETDAYVAEQALLAELVGVPHGEAPEDAAALRTYLEGMRPELAATEAAREAARFVLLPPMPVPVQVVTPARPAWATLAALAFASQPAWARRTYRLPATGPTDLATDLGTTAALRALRTTLLAVPAAVREGPHLRAARARLAPAS